MQSRLYLCGQRLAAGESPSFLGEIQEEALLLSHLRISSSLMNREISMPWFFLFFPPGKSGSLVNQALS